MAKKEETFYDIKSRQSFKGLRRFKQSFEQNPRCEDTKIIKNVHNYKNTVIVFIISTIIVIPLFVSLLVVYSDKVIRFENSDTGLGLTFPRPNNFATYLRSNGSVYYITPDRAFQFDFRELSLVCIDKQYMYDIVNSTEDYSAFMFYVIGLMNNIDYGFDFSNYSWYRNINKQLLIMRNTVNSSKNMLCKVSDDYYFIPFLRLQFKLLLGDFIPLLNQVFYDQYIPCYNVMNETESFKTGFGTTIINILTLMYNYDVDELFVYKDFYRTKIIPPDFPASFIATIRNDLFTYTLRSVSDITD